MADIYKFIEKNIKIELVYSQEKTELLTYKTEIENVLDEKIFLKNPAILNSTFNDIPIFSKLNIIIYTEEGVLTGNVNLLKRNEDNICISFPYNNKFCQRREDTRLPMHIDFEIEINKENDMPQKLILKSKNISGKGIAVLTAEPLPDFQVAKITMFFDNQNIEALCRKVYSKEMLLSDRIMYINGIAFTEISKEDVRTIMKNCLKFQIASQHNEKLFESL